jgi:hypothetical protein
MIEFLLAAIPLLLLVLATAQLSLLWVGKGAVDTAAHLSARKFARIARADLRTARVAALAEALETCRNRPGGSLGSVALTTLDIASDSDRRIERATAGDPIRLRLTHGVELVVPWIDRIFYALSSGKKIRVGDRYYLMLQSERWVTVE